MSDNIINFKQWPKDNKGNPIFTSTEDALFYAELISRNGDECFNILRLRFLALFHLQCFNLKHDPDLQEMLDLAVEAQLYRECLEEIRRIRISDKDL